MVFGSIAGKPPLLRMVLVMWIETWRMVIDRSDVNLLRSPRWAFPSCSCHKPETTKRAVFYTLPADVANELAYVPDQMILDFLFIKVTLSRDG